MNFGMRIWEQCRLKMYLELFIDWLIKGPLLATGWHEHVGIQEPHLIGQHHRKNPHNYTVPEEYWKEPEYEGEEEATTDINLTDIARQYNISSNSLGRALRREIYIPPEQLQWVEHYTAEGRQMKVPEVRLTPAQVQLAHQIAREVSQRSLGISRRARVIVPGRKNKVLIDRRALFSRR